ncbi:hypothetical protein [Streptomyces sp. NPDC001970]
MDSPTAPGPTLRTPEGGAFRFHPGALCPELLPTGGPGGLARYEVPGEPDGLVRWAAESRLARGTRLTWTRRRPPQPARCGTRCGD